MNVRPTIPALFTALLLGTYSQAVAQPSQDDIDALYDCVDETMKGLAMVKVWGDKFKGGDEAAAPFMMALLSLENNPRYASSTAKQGKDLQEYMSARGDEHFAFETGYAVSVQSRADYRKRIERQAEKADACFQKLPQ